MFGLGPKLTVKGAVAVGALDLGALARLGAVVDGVVGGGRVETAPAGGAEHAAPLHLAPNLAAHRLVHDLEVLKEGKHELVAQVWGRSPPC